MRTFFLVILGIISFGSSSAIAQTQNSILFECATYADVKNNLSGNVNNQKVGNTYFANQSNFAETAQAKNAENVNLATIELRKSYDYVFICPVRLTQLGQEINYLCGAGGASISSVKKFNLGYFTQDEILNELGGQCVEGTDYGGGGLCELTGEKTDIEFRYYYEIAGNVTQSCQIVNDIDKDGVSDLLDMCDGENGSPYEYDNVYDEAYSDESKRGCERSNECAQDEERLADGQCYKKCNAYEVRNPSKICVDRSCPVGTKLNKISNSCDKIECAFDEIPVGNYCVKSTCPVGKKSDGKGGCTDVCPSMTKYNPATRSCDCTLEDVKELTDPYLKEIENIVENSPTHDFAVEPQGPITTKLGMDMQAGKTCLMRELTAVHNAAAAFPGAPVLGGKLPSLSSIYRPLGYQDHFADIMAKYEALQAAKASARLSQVPQQCKQISDNILREKNTLHGIKEASRGVSRHTMGEAFDARWSFAPRRPGQAQPNINAIAEFCNLCRPYIGFDELQDGMKIYSGKPDGVHFIPKSMNNPYGFCGSKYRGVPYFPVRP